MKSFVNELSKLPDFYSLRGVSDDDISNAELELGVSFSEEYKEYLKVYGIASAAGHEFTGICKSNRLNVVCVTQSCRRYFPNAISWYVVEETNIDGILVWQSSSGEVYLSAPGKKIEKIFNSLMEYIESI